ncbi:MAG TPA: hypothetical protein DCO67_10450, partial [Staphylococcus sp.]|nr:hypothetical protein [Staphylococcus sp.]
MFMVLFIGSIMMLFIMLFGVFSFVFIGTYI